MTDMRDHASTTLMGCFKINQMIVVSDLVLSVGGNHV